MMTNLILLYDLEIKKSKQESFFIYIFIFAFNKSN